MAERSGGKEQGPAEPSRTDALPHDTTPAASLSGLAGQGGNRAFSEIVARVATAPPAPGSRLRAEPHPGDSVVSNAIARRARSRRARDGTETERPQGESEATGAEPGAPAGPHGALAGEADGGAADALTDGDAEGATADEAAADADVEDGAADAEAGVADDAGGGAAGAAAGAVGAVADAAGGAAGAAAGVVGGVADAAGGAAGAAAGAVGGVADAAGGAAGAAAGAAGGVAETAGGAAGVAAGAAAGAAGAAAPGTAGIAAAAKGAANEAAAGGAAGAAKGAAKEAAAGGAAGAAKGAAGADAKGAAGGAAEEGAAGGAAGAAKGAAGGAAKGAAGGGAAGAAAEAGPVVDAAGGVDAATTALPPPVQRASVPAAAFNVPEAATVLPPPQPDDDPGERKAAESQAQAELATDAATARAAVDGFVAERTTRTDELAAMRPQMEQEVAAAESEAVTAIGAAADAQVAQVLQTVATLRADITSQAASLRGQVESGFEATTAAIRDASERARQAITDASGGTLERAETAETSQLTRLTGIYTRIEGDFRAAADQAGSLAVAEGARRAGDFRSHKINREDGFWDGYLTDNRCEAQAEAAEKVGAAYRDELRKEGDKQAKAMRERLPTDEGAVRSVTTETRKSLDTTLKQALAGVDGAERESLKSAAAARTTLLGQIDSTEQGALASLSAHEATQVAQLRTLAAGRTDAVRRAAGETTAALAQAVDTAVADVGNGLTMLVGQLNSGPLPEPETLAGTLSEAGAQLDAQMGQLREGLSTQSTSALDALRTAGADATADIDEAGKAGGDAAFAAGAGTRDALSLIGTDGLANLRQLATGHDEAASQSVTGYKTATDALLDGQAKSYERINTNLEQGAQRNVETVRTGLSAVAQQDIHPVITEEAAKARAQVLPRWKSVLKWVIIIAIVLVVAIVLGPLVIGAAAGAATALGASAVVGTIVGGALVGAATSAVITVIDNGFAGRKLTTGLGTAIVMGAIGGGIGGAAAGLLQGPMQGMTAVGRYATQLGVDMVIDTGMNLATGNLTWESFGTSLAMSALVNGVTAHPRVSAFSEGLTSRGFGAGYDAGAGARARITGTAGPGSQGPITSRAEHINRGDTLGPNSPYGPRWDFRGGGHNAGEFRARIAGEGGGLPDYQMRTTVEDPITGVAIDEATRYRMEPTPGGGPPRRFLDPAGAPVQQTSDKSLFPPSMDRPQIAAAGQRAVELAIGGAPGTQHTPPPGPNQNGSFRAIVTTPEGHPILVEGHYRRGPTGDIEIQTVYPVSDRAAGTIPAVPGSRTRVPGAATPADYGYGD
jgi:hypothetical protein